MSFANPLAFFFLLAIPVILLFHLFRVRRVEARVTTYRFWHTARREREAIQAFLRRLHPNLLLLLQILAVALLTLALTRPSFTSIGHGWSRTVLIVDASASMQASDIPNGRFAAARAQALDALGALAPGQEAMLIAAAPPHPQVLVPFTQDRELVEDALERLKATDMVGSVDEALRIALELTGQGPPAEIRLFTDAAFAHKSVSESLVSRLRWHVVGRRADNVGITALKVRESLSSAADDQVYLAVTNFSSESRDFVLRTSLNDALVYQQSVNLAAGVRRSFIIPVAGDTGGVLRAEIDLNDNLALDNVAHAILPEIGPLDVLLVTRANAFLEEALRADSHVRLRTITPALFQASAADADIVVLDDLSPRALPPGRYLLAHSLPGDAPLQQMGDVERPAIFDWERDHPIMQHLDLSNLAVQRAMRVRPIGAGAILAESPETPLIYAWDEGDVRALFIGFDLYQSDLPVRVAFPILVRNGLRWLDRGITQNNQLQGGETIDLEADQGARHAVVIPPNGREQTVLVEEGRVFYEDTETAGVYTVRVDSTVHRFAVNLLNAQESDLTPGRALPSPADREEVTPSPSYRTTHELWPVFAILALLILVAEAALYFHQRRLSASSLALAVRGLVLLLIGLSLTRPQVPVPADAVHVAFLLDHSDSVPVRHKRSALEDIKIALSQRGEHDTASVITFSGNARLEAISDEETTLMEIAELADDNPATDISHAIRLAIAALPREGSRRILLMSDGNENKGVGIDAGRRARRLGAHIYALPIGGAETGEVLLTDIVVPGQVDQGEPFEVRVIAWSASPTDGELQLYRDGSHIGTETIHLEPGKNVFSYRESRETQGSAVYEARLDVAGDVIDQNNSAVGAVVVRPSPQILYIDRDRDQATHLIEALEIQSIRVDHIDA
ncbi:MAG: VWA domain-containing protein, partial [Gammaproteobacteria bacterium]